MAFSMVLKNIVKKEYESDGRFIHGPWQHRDAPSEKPARRGGAEGHPLAGVGAALVAARAAGDRKSVV